MLSSLAACIMWQEEPGCLPLACDLTHSMLTLTKARGASLRVKRMRCGQNNLWTMVPPRGGLYHYAQRARKLNNSFALRCRRRGAHLRTRQQSASD